jgi:8-oxo-dGTP diphosphatase
MKEPVKVITSVLIQNEKGEYLAIKLKDVNGKLIYIAPGGRPDEGEPLRGCAIREAKEEVNLDVEIESIAGILEKKYDDGIWTILYYNAKVIGGDLKNMEEHEIEKIAYVKPGVLEGYEDIQFLSK